MDAAGQLPPASNLKRFIAEGADLVCFSGGKAIGGPQGSGILCGRRDLISAAALQHLDQDVLFELWNPPPSLIDKGALPGAPQHGLGRPCKVGKEQIVGMITALRLFVSEGDGARFERWKALIEALVAGMEGLPHTEVTTAVNPGRPVPVARLAIDEGALGITGVGLVQQLMAGDPGIHVNTSQVYDGVLLFNPMCLREGDAEMIARRLRELVGVCT